MKNIGLIGLGDMGAAIAYRLLSQGYKVISTKRGKYEQFIEHPSFVIADDLDELGRKSNIIFLCVDTIDNLNKIIFSQRGLINAKKIPKYIFDFGTGKPSNCVKISKEFAKRGRVYIDMPMGRTPAHAREGKLNLFISASEHDLREYVKLIKIISENQFYLEQTGGGTKIKLLNNFYGQAITLIFGKMLETANDQNICINNLVKVMSAGPLSSDILHAIRPYYDEENTGSMEFSINNAFKDLVYFQEEFGTDSLIETIIGHFQKAIENGHGTKSVAEISKYANQ